VRFYHFEVSFPIERPRRLRRSAALRRLVAETTLSVDDLVAPLFVREGIDSPQPIGSLPGVVQHTRESLRKEVRVLADAGVPGVILFGIPARKDAEGSEAWNPDGIVQMALRDVRQKWATDSSRSPTCCLDKYRP
jgi:porphobilinogen synthase